MVYQVGATYAPDQECNSTPNSLNFTLRSLLISQKEAILPPLLEHTSHSEAHFHPLTHPRPLLLHAHSSAPFTSHPHTPRGLNLTLYTSQDCKVASLHLRVDWWSSLGRAGARYWTAVPAWAVGVVVWMLFNALGEYERGGTKHRHFFFVSRCNTDAYNEAPMPSVSESLSRFTRGTLPRLLVATFILSLLPLSKDYVLGNGGEVFFAPHAPFVLLIATGLVVVSWWLLGVLMWPIRKSKRILTRTKSETGLGIARTTLLSMLIILILISTLIPWQVAFLVSWSIHLVTCATHLTSPSSPGDARTPPMRSPSPRRTQHHPSPHDAEHVLLLLTWLLPLTAPVLAVWARTLATAGLGAAVSTAGGDHNVLSVAPYLVLVDFASWTRDALFLPVRCVF